MSLSWEATSPTSTPLAASSPSPSSRAAAPASIAPEHVPGGTSADPQLAEWIVERAYADERERRRRQPWPRWVRFSMRAMPKVLAIVTIVNGLIGLLAIVTPWLGMLLGSVVMDPIYTAYSFICPQRPSHTWFIDGAPMAMEQRMVAMYVAFGIGGLLYLGWARLRRPISDWLMVAGVSPALIDVAISTAGIRHSTAGSRLWTGVLAALAIVWWAYPRFEAQLRQAQEHFRARLSSE